MSSTLFFNGRVLHPHLDSLSDNSSVLVRDGIIAGVSATTIDADADEKIDLRGMTIMPGLIDCHVHVVSSFLDLLRNAMEPTSLTAFRAARVMNAILMRGFTTVRDVGGADIGLVLAEEQGLIEGPRLIHCGKGFSTTGGHCDIRSRTDDRPDIFGERLGSMGRLVDGVEACRLVAREELKAGAKFIKIMANGGVASPNDPINMIQYSRDEILAILEEVQNNNTYISAHLYTDRAIRRAVEFGIHSLEHCNLIEPETADMAAAAGCVAVPTLVAYEGLALEGEAFGLSAEASAKIETVRSGGIRSLSVMQKAGLPMAFGSDLLGPLQKYHSMEFEILNRVLPAAEIIRSATLVGARLCHLEGQIGVVAEGAAADLLVVEGNPYEDITVLGDDGAKMKAIMRRGRFAKKALN